MISHRFGGYLEIYLFFWGFVPLPLKLPCSFSFVAKKRRLFFTPSCKQVCLFVCSLPKHRKRDTRITNERKKRERKQQERIEKNERAWRPPPRKPDDGPLDDQQERRGLGPVVRPGRVNPSVALGKNRRRFFRESLPSALVGDRSGGESDSEFKTRPSRRFETRHILPLAHDAPERGSYLRRVHRGRDAAHGHGIRPELFEE